MIKTIKKQSAKKKTKSQAAQKPRYILLDLPADWKNHLTKYNSVVCTTDKQIQDAARKADKASLWIASRSKAIDRLLRAISKTRAQKSTGQVRLGSILMLSPPRTQTLAILHGFFKTVIGESDAFVALPPNELTEVLSLPKDRARDLLIGGLADIESKTLVLIRGDLDRLIIPFHVFRPSGNAKPDFDQFKIVDYGQTIQFGNYEAAADFVLYQADPDYRKRINAKRRNQEKGFGPSLRRLRHLRNLSRDDFNGVAEKTIARIERGQVGRPRGKTLQIITETLDLSPDEIESY